MDCLACSRPNREERRFCGGCGARLWFACGACCFQNEVGAAYCGGCGAEVGEGTTQARSVLRVVEAPPPAAVAKAATKASAPADEAVPASIIAQMKAAAVAGRSEEAPPTDGTVTQEEIERLFVAG